MVYFGAYGVTDVSFGLSENILEGIEKKCVS
jgi:hypothetical protein